MVGSDTERAGELKELAAGKNAAGMRLDQWLASELASDFSRSRLKALIETGNVKLNGRPVTQARTRVAAGDICAINLPSPAPAAPRGEEIPLDIVFEDDDLIVINKPPGLVVHPAAGNPAGTLVNALVHHCGSSLSGIGGVMRPGIVHRLDKDTSGVMVVAKSDRAHRALSAAFADHGKNGQLERAYRAIVWGVPEPARGTIDAPLGRASNDRLKKAVVRDSQPDARRAVTHYRVIEKFGANKSASPLASAVECRLETGRTHQIRVHMAYIGHPLIGDRIYGRAFATKVNRLPEEAAEIVGKFNRQALHALLLAFTHPVTGQKLRFHVPPPEDLSALENALRGIKS